MSDWRESFVLHLERLHDTGNRGALAALKRGLGRRDPELNFEGSRWVAPWLPDGLSQREVREAYLVAALFASHPMKGGKGNIGTAIGKIPDPSDSIEKRFIALVDSDEEDFPVHIRQAVSLLKANDVPVNWKQLMKDICYWGHPDKFVQKKWVSEFWKPKKKKEE